MCSERAHPAQGNATRHRMNVSPWPSTIELHTSSRTVELVWDGAVATLSHKALRVACRCADCESARRCGVPSDAIPDDIELLRMEPIADSGLRFFFSDGHDRGIYPWAYLFQLAFAADATPSH
jgi:DUF971 family protein